MHFTRHLSAITQFTKVLVYTEIRQKFALTENCTWRGA